MTEPERIELTPQEIDELLDRLENHSLMPGDYETLKGLLNTVSFLDHVLREKKISITRLKKLFGIKTEKSSRILKDESGDKTDSEDDDENDNTRTESIRKARRERRKNRSKERKKIKGHGRNSAELFTGARKISVKHLALKPGDSCPECIGGKLYDTKRPGVIVTLRGGAPIEGTVYELQKLRCSPCGEVFTALLPEDHKKEKYDSSAGSMIALLKYGCGFPFYRLDGLQKNLGVPLPASTQWEIVKNFADLIEPVHDSLVDIAAQGDLIHNDDTNAKILYLDEKDENIDPSRKGIFTTGILSVVDGLKIALYFTGRKHAGENITDLLRIRANDKSPPIQMCDALSRNVSKEFESILCNCLTHGRRKFVDIIEHFPDECSYVIELLGEIYWHDAVTRKKKISAEKRLAYHQEKSGPLMRELELWFDEQFKDKKVEPNSSLGKAIKYFQNHWEPLTRFLSVSGAPLDNNILERALKKAILHRKNSYFFKTEKGARVADIFMSIIETCRLNGANPHDYLTSLHKYIDRVTQDISTWMPWNYRSAVESLS